MSRAATDEIVRSETLFGGVSRVPPHLRLPNQVEDAENVLFGIRDGAARRPGTWTIRQLCSPPGFGTTDLRMHIVERDNDERYMVIYGRGTLRVFDMVTWKEATVNIGATALAYIEANGAEASQLRMRSAVDATIIVNTTVITQTTVSDNYAIDGTWKNYDVMTSVTPGDGTKHRTMQESPGHPPGYFGYDVDGTTFATARFEEVSGSTFASPAGQWNNSGDYGFNIRFRKHLINVTSGIWTAATRKLTTAGWFAGYTHAAGDQINITGGTGWTPGWFEIEAKDDDNTVTLVAAAGQPGADNANTTANAVGTQHEVIFHSDGNDTAEDMSEVAERFEKSLQATSQGADALVAWHSTGFQKGYFVITAPYRSAHAAVYAPTAPAGGVLDLTNDPGDPFRASTMVLTAGTGSGSLTLGIDDRWTKAQPPAQTGAELDHTTMPMRLTRTTIDPLVFGVFPAPWVGRFLGDDENNPAPSLFRSELTISDVTFHANRILFVGGDKIAFGKNGESHPESEADESIYDFFKTDPSNIVETDPFQETIAADEIAHIDYIAQFRKSLTFFTLAGRQFDMGAPDAVVAAGRVAITPSTRYTTAPVRPAAIDEFLYFIASLGCESRLFEYSYDELTVASKADDVSKHVPEFLPETIRTVQVSANHEIVLLLEERSDRIYVFRTHTDKTRRLQAAWSRWSFGHEVLDIAISGNDCFLLVDRAGVLTIERMALEPETIACKVPVATGCPSTPAPPPKPPPAPGGLVGPSGGPGSDPPISVGSGGGIGPIGQISTPTNDPNPTGHPPFIPGGSGGSVSSVDSL